MKVLAMTIAAGAALCSVMAVPASAIPMSNLAAQRAASRWTKACGLPATIRGTECAAPGTITAMEETAPATAMDQTPPAIRKPGSRPDACSNGYRR
jgi:hypothetical protein